jgi:putative ABC transport system permease protein
MKSPRYGTFLIVRRSLAQHAVSTWITALSLALASGLVIALFSIQAQSRAAFTSGASAFDAVLGARGSQLQIVLNSVFHLETSPGNLRWSWVEELGNDPGVEFALPYALGDSYRGFRIVGTQKKLFEPALAGKATRQLAEGRAFEDDLREIVAGSYAAARCRLKIGSRLHPTHGLAENEHHHDEEYVVVGIAAPTNTPDDRVLWMPIEGVFRMGGHVLRGDGEEYEAQADEEIPEEAKEISALMLRFKNFQRGLQLDQTINREGSEATLAFPIARVMAELFDKLGWMNRVLTLVAYLTVLVGAASILASLYNTMNERRAVRRDPGRIGRDRRARQPAGLRRAALDRRAGRRRGALSDRRCDRAALLPPRAVARAAVGRDAGRPGRPVAGVERLPHRGRAEPVRRRGLQ